MFLTKYEEIISENMVSILTSFPLTIFFLNFPLGKNNIVFTPFSPS